MKSSTLLTTIGAVVVVAILAIAFAIGTSSGGATSSMTTSSNSSTGATYNTTVQAGNETYVATLISTMESAPSTSSTFSFTTSATTISSSSTASASSTTSTTSWEAQRTGSSYSYTASSQVKVLSVAALTSRGQQGDATVTFVVTYENIWSSDIYILQGGGSNLNVTIASGSSILQTVTGPRCMIAVAMTPLAPGDQATAVTPGCWSGFHYQLLQPGSIEVLMTLGWSNATNQGGSLEITADFALG